MLKKIVVALGGNAILRPKEEATFSNQLANVKISAEQIMSLKEAGHNVVIVHGNGPQVGNIIRQNEEAKSVVPSLPLDACSAESQGLIGYMLTQSLRNEALKRKMSTSVAWLLTETEVELSDPAFAEPSKPIGVFYDKSEAQELALSKGWVVKEDAGRGYRRVVASPEPVKIHGVEQVAALLNAGTLVVSTGGGGIPITADSQGQFSGVDAVIDKDRSALKLAEQLEADVLMILTDVPHVYINYNQPNQEKLTRLSVQQAFDYVNAGHFAAGSMGPKMEAAIAFAKSGKIAIICSLDEALLALEGKSGTRIEGN